MLRIKVSIELDVDLDQSEQEINYTLMDALAEFQSARHYDGETYVAKRYSYTGNPYSSPERRAEKVEQVNRRIKLAESLRNGIKEIEYLGHVD